MTGKWESWLRSWRDRPGAQLTFRYRTGVSGSLADFAGDPLLVLFARSCSKCRDVLSKLAPILQDLRLPLLILADQAMEAEEPPEAADVASATTSIVTASASFPEIYLGFNVPRGVWLKYPTLFLLDEAGRVHSATDVPEEMTDRGWLQDRMAECTTVPTKRP
jgi:hypothetical protein